MKKSLLISALVFSLVALLVVGGTMAWFTDSKELDNKFTAGTVKIKINEHEFTDIDNWNPGDTTNKKVSVKSEGSKKTYVRVALTPVWGEMVEEEFVPDDSLSVDNVILDVNTDETDDWMLSGGWYYYKGILEADAETSNLLESVTLIGGATGNDYQGKTLRINVAAEAVQASNDAYKTTWSLDNLPWAPPV